MEQIITCMKYNSRSEELTWGRKKTSWSRKVASRRLWGKGKQERTKHNDEYTGRWQQVMVWMRIIPQTHLFEQMVPSWLESIRMCGLIRVGMSLGVGCHFALQLLSPCKLSATVSVTCLPDCWHALLCYNSNSNPLDSHTIKCSLFVSFFGHDILSQQ